MPAYRLKLPNPHLLILNPPVAWQLEKEAAALCREYDSNVEWIYPEQDHFRVLVYERGVGLTQACGSGAMATFKVLQYLQRVTDCAHIKMLGGDLTVRETGARLCISGKVHLVECIEHAS